MASFIRGETGWQTKKTLAECMRYTFDNEIAADVIFEVGPPGGATVNIRAHKVILISRCEVFQAMFSCGMTESNGARVRVEDVDADTFKDLLRYIYSEVVSVNAETAPSLVYAARKYMLPALVRECGVCLADGLNVNNVIQVLDTSFIIGDRELERKCLQLIVEESRSVFTGTEILAASPQAMEVILRMDKIPVKEVVIYNTCIAWAKHQLQFRDPTENEPTDLQIRETLGSLLHLIRFPIMQVTEFAEISEGRSILTAEEKASIFYFLTVKVKGSQLMFSTDRRGFSDEVWIDRTVSYKQDEWYCFAVGVDAIDFTTNQDILLTGLGIYTGHNGIAYEAEIEILQSEKSLFKKKLTIPSTGDEDQFKLLLNDYIYIKAGVRYSVTASPRGKIGHYGADCEPVCTNGAVTFRFTNNHQSLYTTLVFGQIPRFYFRF